MIGELGGGGVTGVSPGGGPLVGVSGEIALGEVGGALLDLPQADTHVAHNSTSVAAAVILVGIERGARGRQIIPKSPLVTAKSRSCPSVLRSISN
jgi:hypothetical protein